MVLKGQVDGGLPHFQLQLNFRCDLSFIEAVNISLGAARMVESCAQAAPCIERRTIPRIALYDTQ